MNVKELKEFLKDIDDDVEIFSYQQKQDNFGFMHSCYDKLEKQKLSFQDNKIYIFYR